MFNEKRFISYLKEVQKYPGMYFGRPSLERLSSQLVGFQIAYELMDIPLKLFPEFDCFVLEKYPSDTIINHLIVIREQSNFDDRKAFYFFFELLNEFLENGGRIAVIREESGGDEQLK